MMNRPTPHFLYYLFRDGPWLSQADIFLHWYSKLIIKVKPRRCCILNATYAMPNHSVAIDKSLLLVRPRDQPGNWGFVLSWIGHQLPQVLWMIELFFTFVHRNPKVWALYILSWDNVLVVLAPPPFPNSASLDLTEISVEYLPKVRTITTAQHFTVVMFNL